MGWVGSERSWRFFGSIQCDDFKAYSFESSKSLHSYYRMTIYLWIFVVVQLLSHVQLFANPWTAACQASLSFTISQSLLKLMSIESVMPSNISSSVVLFFSCLQSFPASGSFLMSWLFILDGQSIGASVSASVLPMNIQDWFPLGLTSLILLQFKWLSRVFSNTTVQKHQFFNTQPSLWSNSHSHPYMTTRKTIALTIWTFVGKASGASLPLLLLTSEVAQWN